MIKSIVTVLKRSTWKTKNIRIAFAGNPRRAAENTLIFFPIYPGAFACGIAALVAFKGKKKTPEVDTGPLETAIQILEKNLLTTCLDGRKRSVSSCYLGGGGHAESLVKNGKKPERKHTPFFDIFTREKKEKLVTDITKRLTALITAEKEQLSQRMALLSSDEFETAQQRLEACMDAQWCLDREILKNFPNIRHLNPTPPQNEFPEHLETV